MVADHVAKPRPVDMGVDLGGADVGVTEQFLHDAEIGAAAHQAVMHVHFHIIPKLGSAGLGVGWNAGKLDGARAGELVAKMQAAL